MTVKKYAFGPCNIKITLPFEIPDTLPFSSFLTRKESENEYSYDISSTDKIECPRGKTDFDFDAFCVYNDKTYYKKHTGGYYAVRTDYADKKGGSVKILKEYASSLRDKNIFDIIGFEKIANDNSVLIMHASLISFRGEAVLFTAPKQTGKSTQARLWSEYRTAEIINGDKALLYVRDSQVFAAGLPYCGSSNICKNIERKVKCIVRLYQGENDIERMSEFKSFNTVITGSYLPYGADSVISCAEFIARNIPVYSFACKPDKTAVDVLERILW